MTFHGTPQTDVMKGLKKSVVDHYERQLRTYGPTARGMDWKDSASQQLRFAILCEVCDLNGRTVHEIAAGAGHLYDFLMDGNIECKYSGSDLSTAMVEAARERHPDVLFQQSDILAQNVTATYDVVMCSGLFHVKLATPVDGWRRFVHDSIVRMYEMCQFAIAFNLMSDHVDYQSDDLYYANMGETLEFCQNTLSRYVVLRHDYPLYEYTVYVYRSAVTRQSHGPAD